MVGDVIVSVKNRSPAPPFVLREPISVCRSALQLSHVEATPFLVTDFDRSGSYRLRIDPWVSRSLPPRLAGWDGLPSTLSGRPSRLLTSTPVEYPSRVQVVAKKSGLP